MVQLLPFPDLLHRCRYQVVSVYLSVCLTHLQLQLSLGGVLVQSELHIRQHALGVVVELVVEVSPKRYEAGELMSGQLGLLLLQFLLVLCA